MSYSRFVSIAVRCWYHQDIVVVLCISHHVVVWLFTLSRISNPVSPYCVFVSRSSFFCLGFYSFCYLVLSRSVISFLFLCCPSRLCFVSVWWFISGNRFFCSRYFFYSQFVFCPAYLAISCFIASPSYRVIESVTLFVRSFDHADRLITRWSVCHFFVTLFRWLVFTRNHLFVIVF